MLKPLIKISFSSIFSNLFDTRKKGGKVKKFLLGILGAYLVFAIFLLSFTFFYSIAPTFIENGTSWLYFSFTSIVVLLIAVLGSFTIAQSLIYNSKDNELLLSMPIKVSNILLSRVFVLLIFNFIYSLLILIPSGIVYSYLGGFSAFGLVAYIVLSLLLPFFGVSISIIIAWLLTLLTKRMKNKSIFTFIFAIVFLLGYMYLSFNLQDAVTLLIRNVSQVSVIISKYLGFFYLYGSAVTDGNVIGFLIFALIVIALFTAVILLLSATFMKLVNSSTVKIKTTEKINLTQSSCLKALLKKEFSRFVSLPTYLLNTTVGGVLSVIFSVILLIRGEAFLENFSLIPQSENMFPVIIATVISFCAGMNSTTVSSISLEGQAINIIKSLPINHRDFYNSKILLNLLTGVPITLIASIISCFAFEGSMIDKVIVLIFPLALQLFAAIAGLSLNMHNPKFDWTNPVYPIKQSFTVLLEIIYALLLSVSPLVLSVILGDTIEASTVCLVSAIITFVIDILIYVHIMKSGKRYFEKMF